MDSNELTNILNSEVQKKIKNENIIATNKSFIDISKSDILNRIDYKFEYDRKTMNPMILFMPDFLDYADEVIVPKIKEYKDKNKNCQYYIYAKYISEDINQVANKDVFLIQLYIGKGEN